MKLDTSTEAVEAIARQIKAGPCECDTCLADDPLRLVRATMRALAAERDAAKRDGDEARSTLRQAISHAVVRESHVASLDAFVRSAMAGHSLEESVAEMLTIQRPLWMMAQLLAPVLAAINDKTPKNFISAAFDHDGTKWDLELRRQDGESLVAVYSAVLDASRALLTALDADDAEEPPRAAEPCRACKGEAVVVVRGLGFFCAEHTPEGSQAIGYDQTARARRALATLLTAAAS